MIPILIKDRKCFWQNALLAKNYYNLKSKVYPKNKMWRIICIIRKKNPMKKFLLMLILTSGAYAQPEVFNVQQYCVDTKPFKKGECNISGNEYSFVFLDKTKKDVTFFFTDTKLHYKISESYIEQRNPNFTSFVLVNDKNTVVMRMNKQKTKIEFIDATNHIYLKVGKSTKLE